MRPDATSRPHDNAISKITSPRLRRPMRKLDAPRDSSLRISLMSARDDWYAGMAPENKLAMNAVATTNSSTGGCSRMSSQNGGFVSTMARLNSMTPTCATPAPNTAPAAASTIASLRNCLTTASRDAPSAVRMPTSFVRCAARSSNRFATFAHAISSTKKHRAEHRPQEPARLRPDLTLDDRSRRLGDALVRLLVLRRRSAARSWTRPRSPRRTTRPA